MSEDIFYYAKDLDIRSAVDILGELIARVERILSTAERFFSKNNVYDVPNRKDLNHELDEFYDSLLRLPHQWCGMSIFKDLFLIESNDSGYYFNFASIKSLKVKLDKNEKREPYQLHVYKDSVENDAWRGTKVPFKLGKVLELSDLVDDGEECIKHFQEMIDKLRNMKEKLELSDSWDVSSVLSSEDESLDSEKFEENLLRFKHSDDYRSIELDRIHYTLTSHEAQVIQILHEAYKEGLPDISIDHLIGEVKGLESKLKRIQDLIRNSKKRNALVRAGNQKGTFRLNL